jgi:hypothetical protein
MRLPQFCSWNILQNRRDCLLGCLAGLVATRSYGKWQKRRNANKSLQRTLVPRAAELGVNHNYPKQKYLQTHFLKDTNPNL